MAGKLPNPNDKGRCNRCCLSYWGKPLKRSKDFPIGNCCYRYGDYCQRVAWNCSAPSSGFRREQIKNKTLKLIENLRQNKSLVEPDSLI